MERTQEGEFVLHHEKLIEYGIVTSNRSSTIKEKLDNLALVENIDYSLPNDVRPQWKGSRGTKHTKVYRRGAPSPKGDYSHQKHSKSAL